MLRTCLLLALLPVALFAAPADSALTTERVASGLTRPVYVTAPDGDPDRLFIVEQAGVIRILKAGSVLGRPFLTIPDVDDTGNEQGLLGLTFDPDYATNNLFYVYFTRDPGPGSDRSVIRRYKTSPVDPDSADVASGFDIFQWPQDFSNHNGGTIQFGPDGYLYLGLGDGGSGGDPNNRAQSGSSLLGKMLRLDPYGDDFPLDPENNYRIPPTNPFVGNGSIRDEVWAMGVRNPYRWSFDRETGDLWIGDVGQNNWEEIDFQPAASTGGENYGWRCYEGFHNFNPAGCGPFESYDPPIHEYSHSQDGFSCSITGGNVYRGLDIPSLQGTYFYADYCSNQIHTFDYTTGSVENHQNRTFELSPNVGSIGSISSFGEDGLGEMYIVDLAGEVFKILQGPTGAPEIERPTMFEIGDAAPNPFLDGVTQLDLRLDRDEDVEVSIFDVGGRLVRTLLDGRYSAGVIPVTWDGRDHRSQLVPQGIYFFRVSAGDDVATRKVTRLR